ncbi:uncharacterized protein B0T23DRAFT_385909 [Neurospora hispaniola]|uniref:Uncharacterized protein n=1 Tax=Neurospora hispaniola TaxID=588809 RepID=A0AAJ0MN48_9PEZI|nr:hypothetical protein B0T23DRAFT_385909 [Neurospora hispaniola]
MPLPGYMTKQLSETRRQDVLRVRMQYPSRHITSIAVLSLSLRFLEVFLFWFICSCWYLAVASPSSCRFYPLVGPVLGAISLCGLYTATAL